jgi:hypothetical protein
MTSLKSSEGRCDIANESMSSNGKGEAEPEGDNEYSDGLDIAREDDVMVSQAITVPAKKVLTQQGVMDLIEGQAVSSRTSRAAGWNQKKMDWGWWLSIMLGLSNGHFW